MTRDDIIRLAKEAEMPNNYRSGEINNLNPLQRFAALVRADEREACAVVCDEQGYFSAGLCAEKIRARSQS